MADGIQMKILVVGGAGLLGRQLLLLAHKRKCGAHATFQSTRLNYGFVQWHECNLENPNALPAIIAEVKPDAVIYAAAYKDVDGAEDNREMAHKVNAESAAAAAKACLKAGAKFVYVSTDYVFDGCKKTPYSEEDSPNPQGAYAKGKYEAEKALLAMNGIVVVRTSVLYGYHPKKTNFVSWLVRELKAGKPVSIVDDQKSCPTLAGDLAAAIFALLEKKREGLYHAAGSECIGRHEFARIAAEVFGLDAKLISPIATSALKQKAPRPLNSCISIAKLSRDAGVKMKNAREGLLAMKKEMEEGKD